LKGSDNENSPAFEAVCAPGQPGEPAQPPCADYINAEDLFYWMRDAQGADIPLDALGVEMPLCCRFCI
jgi:hypothetical protein